MNELEAYDNIGTQYYYLKNINKAIYYHNRTMNGKIEKETDEKLDSIEKLTNSRVKKSFRKYLCLKTIFDNYNDKDTNFVYPHENYVALKEFNLKFNRLKSKELPASPKYERTNAREKLLKRALNKLIYDSKGDYKILRELHSKYRENKRKCKSLNNSMNEQAMVKRQKELLLSNKKVVVTANK